MQCKGFGSKCIVDLNGAPNPLFVIASNALLSGAGGRVGGWDGLLLRHAGGWVSAERRARPQARPSRSHSAPCGHPSQTPPTPPATVTNVRVLNGATMGNGAAAQITGPVRGVTFEFCDFMGNIATDAGAGQLFTLVTLIELFD